MSVETLVKRYPTLGWAKILDALCFAYDNEDLVEADLDRERDLMDNPPIDPRGPQLEMKHGK